MRVGIDGSNLRDGGGQTHLIQLLDAAEPEAAGITQVTVWGSASLLEQLPERRWLHRVHEQQLERGAAARAQWQTFELTRRARTTTDVLFSPGATYLGSFRPFVTMFRNMLPFDPDQWRQYGWSAWRLKLSLLHHVHRATFRRANGVIFLSDHARAHLTRTVAIRGLQAVIPHGVHARFFHAERPQCPAEHFSGEHPFRWLYVSAIYRYKQHPSVVEAFARLRAEGLPVALDLVGTPWPDAIGQLEAAIARVDPRRAFIRIRPGLAHSELPSAYASANGFVFASTCENLPNSLLEAMAASLPIASSDRQPMREILGDAGLYFEATTPDSIARVVKRLTLDPTLRADLARRASLRVRSYDWTQCASETFTFLARVAAQRCAGR